MRQLNDDVARIEIRVEQILFYLRSDRNSPKAALLRENLFDMLTKLVALKARRDQFEQELMAV